MEAKVPIRSVEVEDLLSLEVEEEAHPSSEEEEEVHPSLEEVADRPSSAEEEGAVHPSSEAVEGEEGEVRRPLVEVVVEEEVHPSLVVVEEVGPVENCSTHTLEEVAEDH